MANIRSSSLVGFGILPSVSLLRSTAASGDVASEMSRSLVWKPGTNDMIPLLLENLR